MYAVVWPESKDKVILALWFGNRVMYAYIYVYEKDKWIQHVYSIETRV